MVLADADQDWHVENCWFVVQTGFKVRLAKRKEDQGAVPVEEGE